jgi:hypothetical protein
MKFHLSAQRGLDRGPKPRSEPRILIRDNILEKFMEPNYLSYRKTWSMDIASKVLLIGMK